MILHMAEAVSYERINPHLGTAVRGGKVLQHFTTQTFKILPWSTPCKNHYVYIYIFTACPGRNESEAGGVKS